MSVTKIPFTKVPYKMMAEISVNRVERLGSEILDLIPSQVQDAYHMVDTVFSVKNALFQMPRCITLNRFRYLIQELGSVLNVKHLQALDPLTDMSYTDRMALCEYIDPDTAGFVQNLLVLCVGAPADVITSLPSSHESDTVPYIDTHFAFSTSWGVTNLAYRVFYPKQVNVVDKVSTIEHYLRLIAANHPALSVRTSLLLTDPVFPLRIVPGVVTYAQLVSLASEVIPGNFSQFID